MFVGKGSINRRLKYGSIILVNQLVRNLFFSVLALISFQILKQGIFGLVFVFTVNKMFLPIALREVVC